MVVNGEETMIAGARAGLGMLALAGLLWPATVEAQGTFKCSMMTVNDVQHEWCKRLTARMESVTNGALKGQAFPAGQLGGTAQQIQGVQLGTIEAFVTPPDFLVGIDPRFMVLTSPYLFDDMDHAHRVLNDPDFIDRFLAIGEPKGYKGLSLMVYGPVGIALRTPLHSPDDLKGKKIRINATPIEQAMMSAFGSSGVPMGIVEALQAAQQGVVDGVQSALPAIANFKFYELTKYHANTQHFFITSIGVVSKRWFDSLPPATQQALVKEARGLHKEMLEFTREANRKAQDVWKAGSKDGWIELTAEQRAAFRARIEGIDAKIMQDFPQVKEMLELVRRKANELR
jgi:TRAP-type C4-dicarboxylate transport system substrate-binding protein